MKDLIIERLNEFYSPQNIIINNGSFGYINNSELLDITVDEAEYILPLLIMNLVIV